jgi:Domain of unknown function (DUF4386)
MERKGFRRTAVVIGLLFWLSNLVTLIGSAVAGFIPTSANALTDMYPHATQLVVGTLVAHVNDAAIIGYAVLLYPVVARYGQGVMLGYVAFKVVEALLLLVGAASLLSLIGVSQSYLSGEANGAAFKPTVELALGLQFWAGRLAALAYLVATPALCFVLFRSRLVPRVISVWGWIGAAMLAAGLAIGVGDPTRGFEPGQLLVIPIILWELVFATWLIVRGFNPSPAAKPAGRERGQVSMQPPATVTESRLTVAATRTEPSE